jgi:hypothetical protein
MRDLLREKVEENAELVWAALCAGLSAPEPRDRVMAATALMAEAYGRPAVQVIGDEDRPVQFRVISAFADAWAAGELTEGGDS